LQVHQYDDLLAAGNRDQKRLQKEIATYQGRVSLSPAVEEQYKQLTRDYDGAKKAYEELLEKKSVADQTGNMTNQSEGERMFLLDPAGLPDAPKFPWWYFALGGLGTGLVLGIALAGWLEFRDNAIRTEADAEAVLELPILVAVPWTGVIGDESRNGGFWPWKKKLGEQKETMTV